MKERTLNTVAVIAALTMILSFFNLMESRKLSSGYEAKATDARKFAGTLAAQKLYHEAASFLERHLTENLVRPEEREATLLYLANIYLDNVGDIEKAMATYMRLLHEYPATKFAGDAGRRIIECKERLGRRLEAMTDMAAAGEAEKNLKKPAAAPSTSENSVVVAKIGDDKMTMSDFVRYADELSARGISFNFEKKDDKIKILKEVVAQEVLKRIAAMKRIDIDADVLKKIEAARTQLMIQKLLETDVISKVSVDDMSVKLYYEAHRDEMRKPDSIKLSYVEVNGETDAVAIISGSGAQAFSSRSPKQTASGGIMDLSAEIGVDITALTSEIALANNGDIIKKYVKRPGADSFLVFRREHFIKGEAYPFEAVKEAVSRNLLAKKREDEIQNYILKNFGGMNVVLYEDAFREAARATDEVNVK
ncbi:MAG TPA: peptidylprolyl isomerase [Candidatus Wallbacteria bacterium]|nr:peptidylprolyl isomerase [Candidatus Wallbacteria bacterium]